MSKILILISLILIITSCATTKQLTRSEWLKITTRTYSNTTKDEILNNVEKIFRLSDESDFSIVHTPNGLQASRNWVIFLLISAAAGTDNWQVQVEEIEKSTFKVTTYVNNSQSVVTNVVANNHVNTVTSPTMGNYLQSNSIYELFYSRLDYLMGVSKDWYTCQRFQKVIKERSLWGNYEPLCQTFTTEDKVPENLTLEQRTKIFCSSKDEGINSQVYNYGRSNKKNDYCRSGRENYDMKFPLTSKFKQSPKKPKF